MMTGRRLEYNRKSTKLYGNDVRRGENDIKGTNEQWKDHRNSTGERQDEDRKTAE